MTNNVEALADTVEAVRDRLLNRVQYVWVLKTDTKDGDYVEVFKTEAGARNEAIRWWRDLFEVPEGTALNSNDYAHAPLIQLLSGETSAGTDDYWVSWEEQIVRD